MSDYDSERVETAKTLGDAYRHHNRDPQAFVAGAQYALDSIMREADMGLVPLTASYLDLLGTQILRRAKAGEPQ